MTRIVFVWILAFSILPQNLSANPQSPKEASTKSLEKASRVFRGRVLDESGNPILGAKIGVSMAYDIRADFKELGTMTDKDGKWEWDLTSEPGIVGLSVNHIDFLTERFQLDETNREYSHRLKPSFTVSGRVIDDKGQGVSDVLVIATTSLSDEIDLRGTPRHQARTSTGGEFQLRGLQSRNVLLRALDSRGFNAFLDDASAGQEGVVLTLLAPRMPITFRIVDAGGSPIVGAKVQVGDWMQCGIYDWQPRTNETGEVVFEHPPSQDFAICVEKEGFRFAWHKVNRDQHQTIPLYPPQILELLVEDSEGNPIPNFSVELKYEKIASHLSRLESLPDPTGKPGPRGTQSYPMKPIQGANGKVTITNDLDFDMVRIIVKADDHLDSSQAEVPSTDIASSWKFVLKKTSFKMGLIRGPDGKPVSNALVEIGSPSETWSVSIPSRKADPRTQTNSIFTTSDKEGRFPIKWIEKGDRISIWSESGWFDGERVLFDETQAVELRPWKKLRVSGLSKLPKAQLSGLQLSRLERRGGSPSIPASVTGDEIVLDMITEGQYRFYQNKRYGDSLRIVELLRFIISKDDEETAIKLSGKSHFKGSLEIAGLPEDALHHSDRVYVHLQSKADQDGTVHGYLAQVDDENRFEFHNIVGGNYSIHPCIFTSGTPPAGFVERKYYNLSCRADFAVDDGDDLEFDVIVVQAALDPIRNR